MLGTLCCESIQFNSIQLMRQGEMTCLDHLEVSDEVFRQHVDEQVLRVETKSGLVVIEQLDRRRNDPSYQTSATVLKNNRTDSAIMRYQWSFSTMTF